MILTPIILKNLKKVAGLVISDNVMVAPASYTLDKDLQDHVVVLGYGRYGQSIVEELKAVGQKYIIIEHNVQFYQLGQERKEPIVFGNAAQKHILNSVNIMSSSAVIVAVNNPDALQLICEAVDTLTNNVKTIVTVTTDGEKKALESLHLKHVVVETKHMSRAVVDEVMYCSLD